jgi:orotidine-5'-phosphate decarboxylase
VDNPSDALGLVANIGAAADFYKVGMELYASGGMDIV